MIQAHLVEPIEVAQAMRLFVFALENRLSSTGISEILSKKPTCRGPSHENLRAFVQWCSVNEFQIAEDEVRAESFRRDEGPLNPRGEKLFQEIREMGETVASQNDFGRSHKYWFFRPAWEVDSALWSEVFGEDDPALVIARYTSSFFKSPVPPDPRSVFTLSTSDIFVFDWLVEKSAEVICRGKGDGLSMYRGAIATACGLENVLHRAIKWTSADFLLAITETPEWLASCLISYWAERIDFHSAIANAERADDIVHQAKFIASCVLKHIAPHSDANVTEVPTFSFISDRTIVRSMDSIECIEIEADASDLKPFLRSLAVKIYEGRDAVFGGIFPFTFHEANHIIGCLVHEPGYWLADVTYYDSEFYEADFDFFGLFSHSNANHPDGSIRRNGHAQLRYEVFRDAYNAMERDGLNELARAWWSFFIASQVLVFPGFGLSGSILKDLADHTALLIRDSRVAKAVRFAIAQERDRLPSLSSRISLALLKELVVEPTGTSSPHTVHLSPSSAQIEKFLKERIEPSVWSRLSDQSRLDLIEAEQLWRITASDFGAGRSDWGALVALYARPIEAEVRSHLRPLLERLAGAGLCNVKEPTLGGCVQGIRDAKKALRTGHHPDVPDVDRVRVAELHQFFAVQSRFIDSFRNRATHGNRKEPITPEEFLRWRTAIFRDRLFAVTLSP